MKNSSKLITLKTAGANLKNKYFLNYSQSQIFYLFTKNSVNSINYCVTLQITVD
jgi:hypothetical protein